MDAILTKPGLNIYHYKLVQYIKNQIENIDLSASDVGADPVGSALKALSDAKSYTDTMISDLDLIQSYQSIYNFPNIGDENKIYIDTSTNRTYRWDDTSIKYYCIGSDYNNIDIINGGSST